MFEQCQDVVKHFEEIQAELSSPDVALDQNRFRKLMKEQSSLEELVAAYRNYRKSLADQEDALAMLEEEKDEDMRSLLKEELQEVTPVVVTELEQHVSTVGAVNSKIVACRTKYNKLVDLYKEFAKKPTVEMQELGAKRKEELLTDLTQLMKLSQKNNDDAGMEEAADLRREVNKMNFQ